MVWAILRRRQQLVRRQGSNEVRPLRLQPAWRLGKIFWRLMMRTVPLFRESMPVIRDT